MQFMLLIHSDEKAMPAAATIEEVGMSAPYVAYNDALIKAGVIRGGERLRPTDTATSVRIRNGKTEVLDGPYAETREQFGGFYLIETNTFDEALEWAAKCPTANVGTIEVRPISSR